MSLRQTLHSKAEDLSAMAKRKEIVEEDNLPQRAHAQASKRERSERERSLSRSKKGPPLCLEFAVQHTLTVCGRFQLFRLQSFLRGGIHRHHSVWNAVESVRLSDARASLHLTRSSNLHP